MVLLSMLPAVYSMVLLCMLPGVLCCLLYGVAVHVDAVQLP